MSCSVLICDAMRCVAVLTAAVWEAVEPSLLAEKQPQTLAVWRGAAVGRWSAKVAQT